MAAEVALGECPGDAALLTGSLCVPLRVRKDKGKAEWIKDKGVLKLELPFISDMLEMMGGGS